jgi:hypothetical protein
LERRGREAVSVFGGAFFKKLPGVWGEKPHKTAFSFRQAFSFGGEGAAANVGVCLS